MSNGEDTQQKPKVNGVVKMIGIGMIILILSSGLYYFLSYNDEIDDELKTEKDKTLGEKLDDNGWELYTMTGCGWCEEQKKVLGSDVFGLKIDTCSTIEECTKVVEEQGIVGFPAWINVFNNETRVGFQTIEQLEEMTR